MNLDADPARERVRFLLRIRPDRLAEYRERHSTVWPEMLDALREAGWGNYSLFLRDDGLLVGYLETEAFAAPSTRCRTARSTRAGRPRWRRSSSCPRIAPLIRRWSALSRASTSTRFHGPRDRLAIGAWLPGVVLRTGTVVEPRTRP